MYTDLYNQKTIKKQYSKIKITKKQKDISKLWIKKLKNKELEKEKENYFTFRDEILRDLLGYPEKKILFEKKFVEFSMEDEHGDTSVCFEAKGTKTHDLFARQGYENKEQKTPVMQTRSNMERFPAAFGVCTNYKNFVLLDLNKKSKCHKFNFLDIEKDENKLKEFLSIFSYDKLVVEKSLDQLYIDSASEEREFTKEFYKLYHETRLMLIKAFQEKDDVSMDKAIHYSQLFLNRLIFTFFAEDKGDLEDRLFSDRVLKILETGKCTKNSTLISDYIKKLFKDLDVGNDHQRIFGFNGGLFREKIPSSVYFFDLKSPKFFQDVKLNSKFSKNLELDELSSKVVKKYGDVMSPIITNLLIMDSFDFTSEVNVNILGHIFEQSISDLEELKSEGISKRKKDGVYYTPEYITEYICSNTIIPYLSKNNATTIEELITEYIDDIDELESKIKTIKILDPACGSGAFLVKATEILLDIAKQIQEIKPESEGQKPMDEWTKEDELSEIIGKNIFGVDINEESVEITKLSLFLKMSAPNKKLSNLSQNIQFGNSLVSSKKFDDKAFQWEKSFKDVFASGKFDIIIGNPPYVRVQELDYSDIDYFKSKYKVAHKRIDISMMFFELASNLIKKNGKIGFISSSQFMTAEYGRNLRKLLTEMKIEKFVDFGSLPVFEDVIAYPVIIIYSDKHNSSFIYNKITKLDNILIDDLQYQLTKTHSNYVKRVNVDIKHVGEEIWNFEQTNQRGILDSIRNVENHKILGNFANPSTGLTTGADKILLLDEDTILSKNLERDSLIVTLRGRNIDPWVIKSPFDYAIYPYELKNEETVLFNIKDVKQKFPYTYEYLLENKKVLLNRKDSRKTVAENKPWHGLIRKGRLGVFNSTKIVTPALTKHNSFALDTSGSAFLTGGAGVFGFIQNDFDNNYLLALLNSKLIEYFLHAISTKKQGGYYSYLNTFLAQIPIVEINEEQQRPYIDNVKKIISNSEQIQKKINKFHNRIKERFPKINISRKLEKFYQLNSVEFLNEINKKIGSELTLEQSDEWEDHFESYKSTIIDHINQNTKICDQIDSMVFELYGIDNKHQEIIVSSLK